MSSYVRSGHSAALEWPIPTSLTGTGISHTLANDASIRVIYVSRLYPIPLAPENHGFRLLYVMHQATLPMAGICLEFAGFLPLVANFNRIEFALTRSREFLAGKVRVLFSWESPTFARGSTPAPNRYLKIEEGRTCNLLRP